MWLQKRRRCWFSYHRRQGQRGSIWFGFYNFFSIKISTQCIDLFIGEFPWTVAILKEEKALDKVLNVYQCGGSLIHPSVVLTAAHCVSEKVPSTLKIRAGEWDTQTKDEIFPHQDRQVSEYIIHERYYKGGLFNDVALLFLVKPVEIAENVNTICLPPQNQNFDLQRCFASGWGTINDSTNSKMNLNLVIFCSRKGFVR